MGNLLYIIGQILGVIAVILGFVTYQVRTQKMLLTVQIFTTLTFVLHYLLIGAWSGMALNAVAMVRNIVYARRDLKVFSGKLWPFAFALIMGIMGLLSWQSFYSVFVILGLVINSVCMAFDDPQKIRKSILVTSPLVLIYNISALSVGGIVYESVAVISALVGVLRFRKKNAQ
ncbi:MAG: YgjV family protein [Oscillospiraceae bacterium]|nr:YgjV family protein [Oscillospiraceae bacterium]